MSLCSYRCDIGEPRAVASSLAFGPPSPRKRPAGSDQHRRGQHREPWPWPWQLARSVLCRAPPWTSSWPREIVYFDRGQSKGGGSHWRRATVGIYMHNQADRRRPEPGAPGTLIHAKDPPSQMRGGVSRQPAVVALHSATSTSHR